MGVEEESGEAMSQSPHRYVPNPFVADFQLLNEGRTYTRRQGKPQNSARLGIRADDGLAFLDAARANGHVLVCHDRGRRSSRPRADSR